MAIRDFLAYFRKCPKWCKTTWWFARLYKEF